MTQIINRMTNCQGWNTAIFVNLNDMSIWICSDEFCKLYLHLVLGMPYSNIILILIFFILILRYQFRLFVPARSLALFLFVL